MSRQLLKQQPLYGAVWLLAVILLALLTAGVASAQSGITDDQVNEVARELFCPTCENVPVDVCPTLTCADWREEIRTQLAAGRSKQEIKDYFAAQYGDHVLAEPPRRGFHLLIWLLPVVALVAGGFLFNRYLRRIQRPADAPVVPAATVERNGEHPATDEYIARIERELQEKPR